MTEAGPAILVLASDSRQQAWIARILRTVVAAAESVSHLDGQAVLDDFNLVVANYDGLDDNDRAQLFTPVDRLLGVGPRLLLISSTGDYQNLFLELEAHQVTNLIARDQVVEARDLIVTAQKILRRDIFGLDKYFGWGVERTTTRIRHSDDRNAVIDQTAAFANSLDIHPRLVENIATVVDELITNALYNAPVDAAGRPRFTHLPRTSPVELEGDEEVNLEICCDGQTFGISVADSFGALSTERSISYLVNSFRRERPLERNKKGGAGLGMFMTFECLNHMALNICRDHRTEVIGLVNVRGNYRDFVHRGKSFNVFLCDDEDR